MVAIEITCAGIDNHETLKRESGNVNMRKNKFKKIQLNRYGGGYAEETLIEKLYRFVTEVYDNAIRYYSTKDKIQISKSRLFGYENNQ